MTMNKAPSSRRTLSSTGCSLRRASSITRSGGGAGPAPAESRHQVLDLAAADAVAGHDDPDDGIVEHLPQRKLSARRRAVGHRLPPLLPRRLGLICPCPYAPPAVRPGASSVRRQGGRGASDRPPAGPSWPRGGRRGP